MKQYQRLMVTGLLVAALMSAGACALLGVPKAETFNQRLAGGYSIVTANRQLNASLLGSGVIAARDGENVQKQNDLAREGLDIASTLGGTQAEDKLSATTRILNDITQYLESKRGSK